MPEAGRDSVRECLDVLVTVPDYPRNRVALGAEDKFQALLDIIADGLALIDTAGTIVGINKAIVEISSYPEEELLGRPFETLKMFPPKSAVGMLSHLNQTLSDQGVSPFEAEAYSRSGEQLKLRIQLSPWRKMGKVVGAVAVIKDITGHRPTEEASHDGSERFRNLLETTSDWVWELNEKSVYTYVNPRVRDILGYEPEEVLGKTLFDLMPLQEANRLIKVLSSAVASQKPFKFVQMAKSRKDGRTVLLESSGIPFFDGNGVLRGYRGIHRDITERRQAEEQVQQTFRQLESTVESVIQAISLTVEMRDRYTAGHQERVKQLACAIAREMHLPSEKIQVIRVAGLLHDLGKIFIPSDILTKPGRLTDVEFALIKSHPQSAYDILKGIEFPWPIAKVVFQHHERLDGSGYPSALQGENIELEARIIAVADVVEAMTFHRAYRPALGLDAALKEINKCKAVLYDPTAAEACLDVFLDHGFKWG